MGKASRRRRDAAETVLATKTPETPSKSLVIAACAIVTVLSIIPYGPFHVLPAIARIPLTLLFCLSILATLPGMLRFLPKLTKTAAEGTGLFFILATWFLLKVIGLHPSGTDDNIYFYLASRVSEGAMPYRDFFFSHPPVHLLVPAAVFKIAGYSIGAAKLIPVMAQTLAGLFMYLTIRRVSVRMALISLFAHMSAYQILMGSTDMNGENIMTMFLWASAWAAFSRQAAAAGILAGLAIGTGMYALAAILAIGLAALAIRRMDGAWFLAGFAGTAGAMLAVFGIAGGGSFFEGVFLYHTRKAVLAEGRESIFATGNPFVMFRTMVSNLVAFLGGAVFKKNLYYHGAMFLMLFPAAVLTWTGMRSRENRFDPSKPHFVALFSLVTTILFLLQWAAVNEVYDFYLVPMLSFMCPALAFAVETAAQRIGSASRSRSLIVPAIVLASAWVAIPSAARLNASLWPEESRMKGQEVRYEWREPSILKRPAELSKALFFKDSRQRGRITPYYRHYIWNKSLAFYSVDEIAAFVKAETTPDQTITGASTLAPLIALHAGRRMAADEADTNGKRFSSGMLSEKDFIDDVCSDRLRLLVSASGSYFPASRLGSVPPWNSTFEPARTFRETRLKHFKDFPITLYKVREDSGCGKQRN